MRNFYNVKKSKVTAQINIRNLLDKQYYASTDPDANVAPALGVAPGEPLMATGSLRIEF
jgi:iron complex outermembrane recepter protein